MELQLLMAGFLEAFEPARLLWCLLGVTLGTLFGALPGLGPVSGIALLLPLVFGMEQLSALLLMIGIYQGTMFGGRISAILINVPGDPAAVVSCFDGYPMTQQGRGGYALTLSAIASFLGGMAGFLGLVFAGTFMSKWALKFGPTEYFSLMIFALISTSGMTEKRPLNALIATVLGLLLATVGNDFIAAELRYTFGYPLLYEGISFVPVAIGVFGMSEVLMRIEKHKSLLTFDQKILFSQLFPKLKDIIGNLWAMIRGTVIGFFVGVLPGAGSTVATFLIYDVEKKMSKTPEKFGTGVPQGLSAPEAGNNASVGGSLVPLLFLGVPGSGTAAILLGVLIMLGLRPGPMLFETSGVVVWGAIAGMFIGNVMLLFLNTVFVPFFTYIVRVIQPYLVPVISALCVFGIYAVKLRMFEVIIMFLFGFIGYLMRKFSYPLAPFILALILGKILETGFRQSLMMSHGNYLIFFQSPISAALLLISGLILLKPAFKPVFNAVEKSFHK